MCVLWVAISGAVDGYGDFVGCCLAERSFRDEFSFGRDKGARAYDSVRRQVERVQGKFDNRAGRRAQRRGIEVGPSRPAERRAGRAL